MRTLRLARTASTLGLLAASAAAATVALATPDGRSRDAGSHPRSTDVRAEHAAGTVALRAASLARLVGPPALALDDQAPPDALHAGAPLLAAGPAWPAMALVLDATTPTGRTWIDVRGRAPPARHRLPAPVA